MHDIELAILFLAVMGGLIAAMYSVKRPELSAYDLGELVRAGIISTNAAQGYLKRQTGYDFDYARHVSHK